MITRRSILAGIATLPLGARLLSSVSRAQSSPSGFDYYISPTGSDSNPGTVADPWAITSLVYGTTNYSKIAGNRIGLLPGTYDVSTFSVGPLGVKLTLPSGASGSSTYIGSSDANGNYSARTATIKSDPGESGFVGGGGLIGNDGSGTPSYITIDGLVITGGATMPSETNVQSGVAYGGLTPKTCVELVIQNCEIYNFVNYNDGEGNAPVNIGCIMFAPGPYGALISNCLLHDCYLGGGFNRQGHTNASAFHDFANSTTIENCTMYGCNNGIYQKNNSSNPDGDTIRYCYFYAGLGMGPALCGFNNALGTTPLYAPLNVYNNVFENVGGLYNSNAGVAGLQANASFYNNTIYNSGAYNSGSACFGGWIPTLAAVAAGAQVMVYNNILKCTENDTSYGALCLGPAAGDWTLADYNCYPSGSQFSICVAQNDPSGTLYSISEWRALVGTPDVHSLIADPLLMLESSGFIPGVGAAQYQLQPSSPCKGSGYMGVDMGAWGGAGAIGCSFAKTPDPPSIISIS